LRIKWFAAEIIVLVAQVDVNIYQTTVLMGESLTLHIQNTKVFERQENEQLSKNHESAIELFIEKIRTQI